MFGLVRHLRKQSATIRKLKAEILRIDERCDILISENTSLLEQNASLVKELYPASELTHELEQDYIDSVMQDKADKASQDASERLSHKYKPKAHKGRYRLSKAQGCVVGGVV